MSKVNQTLIHLEIILDRLHALQSKDREEYKEYLQKCLRNTEIGGHDPIGDLLCRGCKHDCGECALISTNPEQLNKALETLVENLKTIKLLDLNDE